MGGLQVCFFEEELRLPSLEGELEKAYRVRKQARELMEYRLSGEGGQLEEREGVEEEDVLRLMRMVCGGYVEDDFSTYLSYKDFQEKKEEFDILRNLYAAAHRKYKARKVPEATLKFRSLLLMVFLEENIAKMSRVKLDELFARHRMVW